MIITARGRPAHVLPTIEEYRRLTTPKGGILEMLAMPDGDDIEFDPPRLDLRPRDVEF